MSILNKTCIILVTIFFAFTSGISFADPSLTLADLEKLVGEALAAKNYRSKLADLSARESDVAANVLGATELEYEAGLSEEGNSKSHGIYITQPLHFNFSVGHLKESIAIDAKVREIELNEQVRSTTIQLAKSILEATYVKKQMETLGQAVAILKDMLAMVSSARGQATTIAVEQIADKLRHKEEELQARMKQIGVLERSHANFNIQAGTSVVIADPLIDQVFSDIGNVPQIKIATMRAAAADSLAIAESGKFDAALGFGTQKDVNAGEKSYVVRISAPIGQVFVNRYEANRLRSESAVLKQQANIAAVQAKQEVASLFSDLEQAKTLLASHQLSKQTAEKLYSLSKQGFSNGIVPFDDLNDAFERLLDATSNANQMEKQYHTIKIDILSNSGGLQ